MVRDQVGVGVGAADNRRPTQTPHRRGDFFQRRAAVAIQKRDVDLIRVGFMPLGATEYRRANTSTFLGSDLMPCE